MDSKILAENSFGSMSLLERKKYFSNYMIAHPYLAEATETLFNYVKNANTEGSPPMIFVVGPSGVGKTTMINKVKNEFWRYAETNLGYNSSYIPIGVVEAIAPDHGNFDWKDHYRRTLMEFKEPLIDYKINPSNNDVPKIRSNSNRADFRLVVENCFKYRRVKVCIIDEAQHLTIVSNGRKQQDQMETLKSLSNKSDVMFVLVGTYDLLTLLNLNGQLSRRSQVIHLPRYDLKKKEDKINFIAIIKSFLDKLPFSEQADLLGEWDYFYERSIGCVGILKNWMEITINNTLDQGKQSIRINDFEKYALSVKQCAKMLWDAENGEKGLLDDNDEGRLLRAQLGLSNPEEKDDNQIINSESDKKKKDVGKRLPVRDPVGGVLNGGAL